METERMMDLNIESKSESVSPNTDPSDLIVSNDYKILVGRMALIIVASVLLFFVYLGYQNNRAENLSIDQIINQITMTLNQMLK